MKNIFVLIFSFLLTCSLGQNGFKTIHKAEKKIEKGKYDKALKLLDKAGSMNYGFCGLTWIDARMKIKLNQSKIYEAKGEYLKAANALNSIPFNSDDKTDSLKMVCFIKALDKKSVKKEIDSCINLIPSIDIIDFLAGIEFNVSFSEQPIYLSYFTIEKIRRETFIQTENNKNIPILDRFKNSIRNQPFYVILQ